MPVSIPAVGADSAESPGRSLFEIAAFKAGLALGEIWYCGDSVRKDVIGSHGAGMTPVRYEGVKKKDKGPDAIADFPYLRIRDRREMIELLR